MARTPAARKPKAAAEVPVAARAPAKRRRRSYKELFLAELTKQSHGVQTLISNEALRRALDWNEQLYKRVKGELVLSNAIIVGRGRGGTVGLADAPDSTAPPALQVFVSYSHRDEAVKNELLKHLEPLKRLNLVETWHDRKISAGDKWDEAISGALEKADIVLLLISIDFINSKYCYDVEMQVALDRQAANEAVVIPIIVRNCMWKSTPFAKLQALPLDGRAIASWSEWDEPLTLVSEGIRNVAERLMSER